MKQVSALFPVVLGLSLAVACDKVEEKGAGIVEAASKKYDQASEELSKLTPEEAKQRVTVLVNEAINKLSSIKDSESAERVKSEITLVLDKLEALGGTLAEKLNLSALEHKLEEVITKFKDDPRVTKALESLRDRIRSLKN